METPDIQRLLTWSLPQVLREGAIAAPDRRFLTVVGDGSWTVGEAWRQASDLAARLAGLNVKPGDRVVLMAGNRLTAVRAWLAINLLGATDVSINTAYRGAPLEHAINLVDAKLLIAEDSFLPVLSASEQNLPRLETILWFPAEQQSNPSPFSRIRLRHLDDEPAVTGDRALPVVSGKDPASIIFTSGTSGPAKGVVVPHAQAYVLARQTVDGLRLGESDVHYCFHPLFHTAGKFIGIYAGLLAGAHVVLDRRFDAASWLNRIREYKVTSTLAHGAMLEMIYALPERSDDSDNPLERFIASPFPKAIAAAFETRFGVKGIEVWGMTEINNPCWNSLDAPLRPGSCGKVDETWTEFRIVDPATDLDVQIGELGEFVVRPKWPWTMMQGYFGMPERTLEAWRNLWFHTGDSGYRDAEGYVYFVDRLGDRIRRRAENIASYDIESVASEFKGIRECAAVGVRSEFDMDDDIKLCIVLEEGHLLDHRQLIQFLFDRLPHYMVPRYIETLDQIPRTPTNKIKKAELRSLKTGAKVWDRKAAGLSLKKLKRSHPS